ncbi:hypothetical protein EIB96_01640 [Vibrio parahaemolyticus]|nr:hypothetical protein [Vibrio parahaemolyticus]EGR0987775.1 hypothetical protein [Vibrio parahaemolyticus]EGR1370207.1 hypothetical protein [Vibrio parahaemolyticus]EGR1949508.1 hypothetical protein [Vibrio parahaemolyticus]EGR2696706.1 hypothetical protein [Vibrio parahaemolyticus]
MQRHFEAENPKVVSPPLCADVLVKSRNKNTLHHDLLSFSKKSTKATRIF